MTFQHVTAGDAYLVMCVIHRGNDLDVAQGPHSVSSVLVIRNWCRLVLQWLVSPNTY